MLLEYEEKRKTKKNLIGVLFLHVRNSGHIFHNQVAVSTTNPRRYIY